MKNFFLLLQVLFVSAVLFVSCGGKTSGRICSLTVKSTYAGFKGYLQLPDGEILDTLTFESGIAHIERADSQLMPYVACVHLVNSEDSMDILTMPFVVEPGNVTVSLSEYISTSGTALNTELQSFLNELQMVSDGISERGVKSMDELNTSYSSFYKSKILQHKDNVVGKYIYEYYGVHLTGADKESLEAVMN